MVYVFSSNKCSFVIINRRGEKHITPEFWGYYSNFQKLLKDSLTTSKFVYISIQAKFVEFY